MRSATLSAAALAALLAAGTALSQPKNDPNIASTDPRDPAAEAKTFHLPPGFEAQLVAAEPDVHKPLNLAFDDRGRLWVTDTVEYPFPAKGTPRDSVKILEDFGPDGRARKVTTFAGGLNIPIGLLPLPGDSPRRALVYSIPKIYRLTDADGDGRAEAREPLYASYGFRDTHGMTSNFAWGADGWVYACHGFSNRSEVAGADKAKVAMESGNTYRLRPDGSHAEQWTWGQVNPFGLDFDPLGNLYSADCHTQPIYQLLRGAYYPSFGKPHDGLGFGPEMFTDYRDSTAISGLAYYAADHYPTAFRGSAFIGDVVTNRIVQFKIAFRGSTPRATLDYFLKCDDPWFRPVNIKLGPDGALYVADFYNRIIGHYEVPLDHPGRDRERGRIWRIVYKGPEGAGTPAPRADWTKATAAELASDLRHPNQTVRVLATNQLALRGKEGAEAVRTELGKSEEKAAAPDGWLWAHGLWVLERCGALDEKLLEAAAARNVPAHVHALRILGERKELSPALHALAASGLKDADANVRRAAADALGRHPDAAANLRPLLDLRHAVPAEDTHLLHVVRMALRDQLRPAAAWEAVPKVVRDAADARAVADVALGVPSAEAAAYVLADLRKYPESGERLTDSVGHVARHGDADAVRGLLAFAEADRPDDLGHQAALFKAFQQGTQERGAPLDDRARAWAVTLTGKLLASKNPAEVQSGAEAAGTLRLADHAGRLAALAAAAATPEGPRAAALKALAALDAGRHAGTLGKVLADAAAPPALREQAATLLAGANRDETREQLLAALPTAPARLQNAIAAGLAGSRAGAEKLLEAVASGKASARLLQERAVAVRLGESKVPGLADKVAKLTEGLPAADAKLQELLQQRHKGYLAAKPDAALGAKVFEKSCAICHQLAGKGAKIGPQLDGVGVRGLDRLLEDTLDPNRNVDQAFRLTTLTLKSGQAVEGLLLKEEGAVYVLADKQGKEVRVPRDTVDERATSQLSPMPANFADQIPEADFYHLLAYLLSQRAKAEAPGGR